MRVRKRVPAPKPMRLAPEFRAKHAIPEGANAKKVIDALVRNQDSVHWRAPHGDHDVHIEDPRRGQWTHYHTPGSLSTLIVSKSRGGRPVTTKYLGWAASSFDLKTESGLLADARRRGLPVPKPFGTGVDKKKGPFITMEYAGVRLADLLHARQNPENVRQIMHSVFGLLNTFAEKGVRPADLKPLFHICINPQTGRAQMIDFHGLYAAKPSVAKLLFFLTLKNELEREVVLNKENRRLALEIINKELQKSHVSKRRRTPASPN